MSESDNELPQPRLVTMGEEMLEIMRPTEWGDVSPDVTSLTTEPAPVSASRDIDTGYTVVRSVDARGATFFAFIETIPQPEAPLELPIDTGNREHSARSIQDTAKYLLDNQ